MKDGNSLISIKLVEDIVHNWNGSAQAKDAKNGKYVISNSHSIARFGLTKPDEVYGFTIRDLDSIMHPLWGDTAKRIEMQDKTIAITQQMLIDSNRAFLTKDGRAYIHNVHKYPILNSKNKVSLILTTNENITHRISTYQLWELYKKLYLSIDKKQAIIKFLEHLNIAQYFDALPTEKELIILLSLQKYPLLKQMSSQLKISVKTIDTHLGNLRNKSKLNLYELVSLIDIV